MKSLFDEGSSIHISLCSHTLDPTILQGCRQIVRLFFPHVCFAQGDSGVRICVEEQGSERGDLDEGGFSARWTGAETTMEYDMPGKDMMWLRSRSGDGSLGKESLRQTAAKQTLLRLLQNVTGQGMPWGILTGVRPGRLWQDLTAGGLTLEDRREVLSRRYLVEEAKIDLLQEVADAQQPFMRRSSDRDMAVYLSIPFCPSRCGYCTFPGYRGSVERKEDYLRVLFEEMEILAGDIAAYGLKVNTVYIGGGTPTALEADQLKRLLDRLTAVLPMGDGIEFCCEAGRPDTLTEDKLALLAGAGVNRLCINPQTLEDETLRRVSRSHSVRDFLQAYALARRMADWHLNVDMILGLPGEEEFHAEKTAKGLVELAPDSITVHYLTLKRGSSMWLSAVEANQAITPEMGVGAADIPGGPSQMRGVPQVRETLQERETLQVRSPSQMRLAKIGEGVRLKLRNAGYYPYYLYRQKGMLGNGENVGYALPGAQSLYNIVMIAESQHIAGLGAGAASKISMGNQGHRNLYHAKDVDSYGKSFRERAALRSGMWRRLAEQCIS